MPRPRLYESNAERQRAYRRRRALVSTYALAEREATLNAAWELCDAITNAANHGDTEAARLNGLTPSQTLAALTRRFYSH